MTFGPGRYQKPHDGAAVRGATLGVNDLSYYVKAMTRGEQGTAKGTPAQAMDYLTDGHDMRRDPAFSEGEVAYISRMGEGWKTEMEGGKVPLVGFGRLNGITDEATLREAIEDSCKPEAHSLRKGAKTGTSALS